MTTEAFTLDQVRLYCSKRQRSLRIDDPSVTVRFIYPVNNAEWVATGTVGVVQVDTANKGTIQQVSFKCVDGGPIDKAWWSPIDKKYVADFHYLRIEGR